MPKLNDLTGQKFGRLSVLSREGTASNGKALWRCLCDCGKVSVTNGADLRSGHVTSCGCWRAERNRTSSLSHGLHDTGTYRSWGAMHTRCRNENAKSWGDYGGRGISVCERWTSFENFLADMGERPEGMTLDRFPNVNGNYEPGNCRWATKVQQARNTSASVFIEFNGECLTLVEWAIRSGVKQATLSWRLRNGWAPLEALSLVPRLGLKRVPLKHKPDGTFASKFGDEVDAREG